MKLNRKILLYLTIAYIYIPVVLFILGFVRWYFAIPVFAITIYFVICMTKTYLEDEKTCVRMSPIILILTILIIISVCIFAGLGGFFGQAGDWYKHNAVLQDLSKRHWPVVYEEREKSMLTYYVGQYLLPALLGKLTHSFRIAEIAMCIWGIAGILLVYYNLVNLVLASTWKKQLSTLFVFLFFCGMLITAQILLLKCYPNTMYSSSDHHWIIVENIMLQYRSDFVMIRWVFPQCVVIWLIAELFLKHYKRIEYYIMLFLPALLFGTFSFLAFVFLAVGVFIFVLVQSKERKKVIKQCASISNILVLFSLGSILFFYFLGSITVKKPDYLNLHFQTYRLDTIAVYFIFAVFMFGIYAALIWKENRVNPIYYLVIIELSVIPFFKMGLYNDFVMCTSIPGLFFLEIFILKFLMKKGEDEHAGIRKGILIVCLIIGMWYPLCELHENILEKQPGNMSADGYETLAFFADRQNENIQDDLKYNYYTYDLEHSIFYRYIAAKR